MAFDLDHALRYLIAAEGSDLHLKVPSYPLIRLHGHLEAIPESPAAWGVRIANATALGAALRTHWDEALLFRDLATLRTDVPVFETVDALAWSGPAPAFEAWSREIGEPELWQRARAEAARRAHPTGRASPSLPPSDPRSRRPG